MGSVGCAMPVRTMSARGSVGAGLPASWLHCTYQLFLPACQLCPVHICTSGGASHACAVCWGVTLEPVSMMCEKFGPHCTIATTRSPCPPSIITAPTYSRPHVHHTGCPLLPSCLTHLIRCRTRSCPALSLPCSLLRFAPSRCALLCRPPTLQSHDSESGQRVCSSTDKSERWLNCTRADPLPR